MQLFDHYVKNDGRPEMKVKLKVETKVKTFVLD